MGGWNRMCTDRDEERRRGRKAERGYTSARCSFRMFRDI
jgi:hypothetical protein